MKLVSSSTQRKRPASLQTQLTRPTRGRALFYYFAEANVRSSNATPTDYPLTLWLNGGPGCSSIGGGAFTELGPFFPQTDGRGLRINYYSWNKVSNIIFLESPAGVGWSYSNTSTDYSSFGDKETAQDSLAFLLGWLELFPEYKNTDFYITGESYAGHYVPHLASVVLAYKGSDGYKFNLKGIAIGNPLFQLDVDTAATYEYLWSHGIISDLVYDDIVAQCNFEDYTLSSDDHNVSKSCNNSLVDAFGELGDYVNNYDVILDVCYPSLVEQELRLRKKVAHMSNGVDVCITSERSFYFNTPEVQQALHANVTNLDYPWSMCSGVLEYHMEDANIDMLPSLQWLHNQGLRILIFSGDQDSVVPLLGTRTLVRQLAGKLRLRTSVPYRAWYDKGQVGGWTIVYGKNLTFATVRGAAHMVPYSQPSRALTLFTSFLASKNLASH
ncbi:hypothetical protein GOP47_0005237 [Adiantum capillus-veneris]|uniref:Carboxypeptidase n=1 Tax=Adiantum capillus-veneris TaxID=13818 RepID=A0A9D4V5V8_ADICA|nr:hypothetical protein GOP47_0005237 [Adiantum capillus-veneris]